MQAFLLFVFGAAIGSFLNVVALRYDSEHFLFSIKKIGGPPSGRGSPIPSELGIGGRSYCPRCRATLRWFELIPLLSFVLQRGRCRHCHARISARYPAVEILSGLIFALVPLRLQTLFPACHLSLVTCHLFAALWILAFLALLLMALIDIRLSLIPDEINIFLGLLGIVLVAGGIYAGEGTPYGSFLKNYAGIFPASGVAWVNNILGALFGLFFFGIIYAATRGRGMGLGDAKLAVPLGFLFGWPDIVLLTGFAFVVGSLVGIYTLFFKGKTMKSALPFGPFLAIGAALTFFAGYELMHFYLQLFSL
jgi:prepilin signal peptidase PulO-like enzyme (type II secretory pathway)